MLKNFVRVMVIANALWLFFGGKAWNTGDTFDAALFAAAFPLFLWWNPRYVAHVKINGWYVNLWPVFGLIGFAMMLPHFGGTAWLIVATQIFAVCVWYSAWAWLMLPVTSLLALFNYQELIKPLLIEHQTRLIGWATYLQHWWDRSPHFVGFGYDSFRFRAPMLEVNGQHFTWAHNDFVEVIFETGFVGIALCLTIIWFLYRAARKDVKNFAALSGFLTCMMFYSPLQVITGQVLALAVVLEIYGKNILLKEIDNGIFKNISTN